MKKNIYKHLMFRKGMVFEKKRADCNSIIFNHRYLKTYKKGDFYDNYI